jgi:hypothetical protein
MSDKTRCGGSSTRVDQLIISTVPRRVAPYVRRTATAPARSIRATAVLFAFGSLLTLVDALLTRELLGTAGMTERWAPVRALMDAVGVDVALAICCTLAVAAMAFVAWAAVRARPALASMSFVVLCAVVAVRVCGCANNFGVMLT